MTTTLAARTAEDFDWSGLIANWSRTVPGQPAMYWDLDWTQRALNGDVLATTKFEFRWRDVPQLRPPEVMSALEELVRYALCNKERVAAVHELCADRRGEGVYRVTLDTEIVPARTVETEGPRTGERTTRYLYEPGWQRVPKTVVVTVTEPTIIEAAA
jgi:hypothetical protein